MTAFGRRVRDTFLPIPGAEWRKDFVDSEFLAGGYRHALLRQKLGRAAHRGLHDQLSNEALGAPWNIARRPYCRFRVTRHRGAAFSAASWMNSWEVLAGS
jgi:hypothetical protein